MCSYLVGNGAQGFPVNAGKDVTDEFRLEIQFLLL